MKALQRLAFAIAALVAIALPASGGTPTRITLPAPDNWPFIGRTTEAETRSRLGTPESVNPQDGGDYILIYPHNDTTTYGFLFGRTHVLKALATIRARLVQDQPKTPDPVTPGDFQVGQEWSVKDSALTLVIGRIETLGNGKTAVSISLYNVPCPDGLGCTTTIVAHLPYDADALAASVDTLLATAARPAAKFEDGYNTWKTAHGGIFTVPVRQIPEILFTTMPSPASAK